MPMPPSSVALPGRMWIVPTPLRRQSSKNVLEGSIASATDT